MYLGVAVQYLVFLQLCLCGLVLYFLITSMICTYGNILP